MKNIGITERGDAALDYTWTEKIQDTDYSVIITKNTTSERFHKAVLEHKDKILLHATITGWGGTEVEPNVPKPHETVASIIKLIQKGFPANQIVWRIDPILDVNDDLGLMKAHKAFRNIDANLKLHGVQRIRVSVFDSYKHALQRMAQCSIKTNYTGFQADNKTFERINRMLDTWKEKGYSIETCAEPKLNAEHVGCVNNKDAQLFGIDISELPKNGQNRFGCLCSTAKTELLSERKQCAHGCAYCYWKDEPKKKDISKSCPF